ncbi:MAG: alkaline phosphatase family protein [Rhodoferax sp.]|nr:alkaline phosphatase family protein [Rhodoferax sp.]
MKTPHASSSLLRCLRLGAAGTAILALLACATPPPAADKPKLLVFIAVDGLPQRQVLAYRDQLAPDGLARFLDRGAWFSNAHYGHAFTVTAAGHATMLTGAYPHRTGIIGNDWRDPVTGTPVYNTQDPSARYIDHATKPFDGTSPKNLKVETVGDVLRRADPRSKVIAISGKDRGAILPAGKTGTAYMYMAQSGSFASSTYYMAEHPAWVKAFNDGKPAHKYFKTEWKPLLDEAAYSRSLPDRQVWYAPGGQLPMALGAGDEIGLNFYSTLLRSPAVDALSLDFARAALDGEGLGQDDAPDILAISLSAHDYINHAFSAESRMSHDHLLQLDRMLQSFFAELDAKVGKNNYLAVLTADHGFTPASQTLQNRGLTAGRQSAGQTLNKLGEGLNQRFGEAKWVLGFSASSILFDRQLLAQRGIDSNNMAEAARAVLAVEPGLGAIYTRKELDGNTRVGEPFFDAMRKSWHPEVSGDLQTVVQLNWMFTGSSAATHGSPHVYDTHVPILLYGPRWIKPGQIDQRVEVIDIAPTLARWFGVPVPAASEGRILPLIAP